MRLSTGADRLLLANPTTCRWEALRAGTGAAVAWAAPRPGAAASEDSLLVMSLGPESAMIAVADGMGGVPGGGDAASRAVSALEHAVEESLAAGLALRTAVMNGIERANESVLEMANGAATTLAVAEISGGLVRAYNIGDSEVYDEENEGDEDDKWVGWRRVLFWNTFDSVTKKSPPANR